VEALAAGAVTLIDVRPADEFAEVHADGSLNIPQADLQEQIAQVPKGVPVCLLDHFGYYAEQAARVLEEKGVSDVSVVEGGLVMWTYGGGPVSSANPQVAARLKRGRDDELSLAAVEGVAADMGVRVDISDEVFPELDRYFERAEDRQEAMAKSWARTRKAAA